MILNDVILNEAILNEVILNEVFHASGGLKLKYQDNSNVDCLCIAMCRGLSL